MGRGPCTTFLGAGPPGAPRAAADLGRRGKAEAPQPAAQGASASARHPLRCDQVRQPMWGPRSPATSAARGAPTPGCSALALLLPPLLLLAAAPSGRAGRCVAPGHRQVGDADLAQQNPPTAQRREAPYRPLRQVSLLRGWRGTRGVSAGSPRDKLTAAYAHLVLRQVCTVPCFTSLAGVAGWGWGGGSLTVVTPSGTHSSLRAVLDTDGAQRYRWYVSGSRHPKRPCRD